MAQIAPLFSSGLPDFASLMSEIVFDPLGMHDTFFFDDLSIDEFRSGLHLLYLTGVESRSRLAWTNAYDGAGGVVSTPNDMMTWLRFNMGRVDTKKTKALHALLPELQKPATPVKTPAGYKLGLGWFLTPGMGNHFIPSGAVWKDGEIRGTNTYITFLPWVGTDAPSEAGVFVLTNCNA